MNHQLLLVLLLLGSAIAMFAINRPRMDVVALLMMTLLPFAGVTADGTPVLSVPESLAGFADPNIVLIAALFVLGEGLVRTGVARRLGDFMIKRTGSSAVRLLVLLMVCVCGLGAFMSSTAVTAIFIPVALRVAQTTGTAPGQLMMPLSFAALISGMMTLVATAPNLVVNAELVRQGEAGFGFFSFTPFGIPILVLGIAYMTFARRWLPSGDGAGAPNAARRPRLADWIEQYDLSHREHRLRVGGQSPLAGRTIGDLDLRGSDGVNIIAVERGGSRARDLLQPTPKLQLEAGDILLLDLVDPAQGVAKVAAKYELESLPLLGGYFADLSQEIGMAEVIVPAESELVGKTVVESGFRSRNGVTVIGLRRGTAALEGSILGEKLRIGDTLLVVGPWKRIRRLGPDESGVVLLRLPTEVDDVLPAHRRAPHAVAILALVVGLMATGVLPNVQAALIGCLLMGAFGCIDLSSAYRSISWKTIVLIVGMLPFSIALQRTGGVDLAADALMSAAGGAGPRVLLAVLFALTAILGMFISNTATAVLMAPVAIALAKELGVSPQPFAMIVALAASTAFITPVSSPVNTLVVAPGNYSFGHFVRVGAPFAVIVLIVSVLLVPILLPL